MTRRQVKHELKRWLRILYPRHFDNGSYQLIKLMGPMWWIRHGFWREVRVKRGRHYLFIDMANPRLKLAIEADGDKYHQDIVHEQERDEELAKRGYHVIHLRWVDIVKKPNETKQRIKDAYTLAQPMTAREAQRFKAMQRESDRQAHR